MYPKYCIVLLQKIINKLQKKASESLQDGLEQPLGGYL